MKKLLFSLIMISCALVVDAQQDPQFTHYGLNPEYINPGAAGMNVNPFVRAIYRNQWLGYQSDFDGRGGNPTSQVLTAAMPVLATDGGASLNVVNDRVGGMRYTSAQLAYSQHIKFGNGARLGVGLQGSFNSLALGIVGYRPPDGVESIPIDPSIVGEKTSQGIFDMGAGVWYQDKLKNPTYYAGLSMSRLLDQDFDITLDGVEGGSKRHMYLTGGYHFRQIYDLVLTPTMLFKTDFAKADKRTHSIELGARAEYQETYWGGLNFRQGGDLGILVGASFLSNKELKVGYALDIVLVGTAAKKGTNHEIMVGYYLPEMVKTPKPIIRTPRYKF